MEWQPIETAPKDGTRILASGTSYHVVRWRAGITIFGEPDAERETWRTAGGCLPEVWWWVPLPPAMPPKP